MSTSSNQQAGYFFQNADFYLPNFAVLPFIHRLYPKLSEQVLLISFIPKRLDVPENGSNVSHGLSLSVGYLTKGMGDEVKWVDQYYRVLENVRGWVVLPDLDTLYRDPLPQNSENVLSIFQAAEESNILLAKFTNEIDITEPTFVGWGVMPGLSEVLGQFKNTHWL